MARLDEDTNTQLGSQTSSGDLYQLWLSAANVDNLTADRQQSLYQKWLEQGTQQHSIAELRAQLISQLSGKVTPKSSAAAHKKQDYHPGDEAGKVNFVNTQNNADGSAQTVDPVNNNSLPGNATSPAPSAGVSNSVNAQANNSIPANSNSANASPEIDPVDTPMEASNEGGQEPSASASASGSDAPGAGIAQASPAPVPTPASSGGQTRKAVSSSHSSSRPTSGNKRPGQSAQSSRGNTRTPAGIRSASSRSSTIPAPRKVGARRTGHHHGHAGNPEETPIEKNESEKVENEKKHLQGAEPESNAQEPTHNKHSAIHLAAHGLVAHEVLHSLSAHAQESEVEHSVHPEVELAHESHIPHSPHVSEAGEKAHQENKSKEEDTHSEPVENAQEAKEHSSEPAHTDTYDAEEALEHFKHTVDNFYEELKESNHAEPNLENQHQESSLVDHLPKPHPSYDLKASENKIEETTREQVEEPINNEHHPLHAQELVQESLSHLNAHAPKPEATQQEAIRAEKPEHNTAHKQENDSNQHAQAHGTAKESNEETTSIKELTHEISEPALDNLHQYHPEPTPTDALEFSQGKENHQQKQVNDEIHENNIESTEASPAEDRFDSEAVSQVHQYLHSSVESEPSENSEQDNAKVEFNPTLQENLASLSPKPEAIQSKEEQESKELENSPEITHQPIAEKSIELDSTTEVEPVNEQSFELTSGAPTPGPKPAGGEDESLKERLNGIKSESSSPSPSPSAQTTRDDGETETTQLQLASSPSYSMQEPSAHDMRQHLGPPADSKPSTPSSDYTPTITV
jgi:hypothetical protein